PRLSGGVLSLFGASGSKPLRVRRISGLSQAFWHFFALMHVGSALGVQVQGEAPRLHSRTHWFALQILGGKQSFAQPPPVRLMLSSTPPPGQSRLSLMQECVVEHHLAPEPQVVGVVHAPFLQAL